MTAPASKMPSPLWQYRLASRLVNGRCQRMNYDPTKRLDWPRSCDKTTLPALQSGSEPLWQKLPLESALSWYGVL